MDIGIPESKNLHAVYGIDEPRPRHKPFFFLHKGCLADPGYQFPQMGARHSFDWPSLVVRASFCRLVLLFLGVSEHRWKGVPNDTVLCPRHAKQLQEVIDAMESGSLDVEVSTCTESVPLIQTLGALACGHTCTAV